jgi:hypothetical protein
MEIEISKNKLEQLNDLKGKFLFIKELSRIYFIGEFKYEKRDVVINKTNFFGFRKSSVIEEKIFITGINVFSFNYEYNFWGTLTDPSIFLTNDIYKLRNDYIKFIKTPLEKLGFDIKKSFYIQK